MAKFVLEVNGLTKMFKNRCAVDDVSFEIIEGEIFGLIGPNGAGKTTIIRMIAGLAKPTSGEIFIDGISLNKHYERAITKLGGIIEMPDLYPYMSGMENLKFFASLYPGITKEKIDSVVKLVGMEKRIHDKVRNYSLGMKQRVGIAQALLHDPKVLILDEPTNGLDPNGIRDMRKFLIGLSRKKHISILVSSHILSEMEQLCDTVAIIDGGKILEVKTLEQIKRGLQDGQKVCIKVDYPNYAGKLVLLNYKVPVSLAGKTIMFNMTDDKIPEITAMLMKEGISVFGIETITKSLEEVFTEMLSKQKSKGKIE